MKIKKAVKQTNVYGPGNEILTSCVTLSRKRRSEIMIAAKKI
jgi:hypothetical protein